MLKLNFFEVDKKYNEILNYAISRCDEFSLIFQLRSPYSKSNPKYVEESIASELAPYLILEGIDKAIFHSTITIGKRQIGNLYKYCKQTRKILQINSSFSEWKLDLPENLCLMKNQNPWLITINHEELCFLYNETVEDINFLKSISIL